MELIASAVILLTFDPLVLEILMEYVILLSEIGLFLPYS